MIAVVPVVDQVACLRFSRTATRVLVDLLVREQGTEAWIWAPMGLTCSMHQSTQ